MIEKGLLQMKKVLLFSLAILFFIPVVLAYETIIIKYPQGELWKKAYYKRAGDEAILVYLPKGQTPQDWRRSIIVHSYYGSGYPVNIFMSNEIAKMKKTNPTGNYKYLKITYADALATRCTDDYKNVKAQCEFYRVTRAHNGIISLHYINRDKEDFKDNYREWYDIIRKAKQYNSYYRDERTFDKAEYFELWDEG